MRTGRSNAVRALVGASALIFLTPSLAVAAPGDLDPTFGEGGIVSDVEIADLVIQADGSIVIAGAGSIRRFQPDGLPDASFGGDGQVVPWPEPQAVAVQPDGRIVVAGDRGGDVALARYLADGTPDPSFSGDGHTKTNLDSHSDIAFGLALTSTGQPVVAAEGGLSRPHVLRYRRNGTLDPTFSGNGIAGVPLKASGAFSEVVVQPDGRIVAIGTSNGRCLLARYRPGGKLDRTFGKDGVVVVRGGEFLVRGGTLQPDGKILAVGYCFSDRTKVCVARFRPGGVLDGSFGGGDGKVTTGLGLSAFGWDVTVQTDGKIVAVGSQDDQWFAVIRYEPDGSLDTDFGAGGVVLTDTGAAVAWARAVAVQDDGRLVVGGSSSLIRYLA